MNWTEISKQAGLTEDFMREYQEELMWNLLCEYQVLSEDFIEEMEKKVNWDILASYQRVSFPFIKKHNFHFFRKYLERNPYLSFTEEDWNVLFPDSELEHFKQAVDNIKEQRGTLEALQAKRNQLEQELRILLK